METTDALIAGIVDAIVNPIILLLMSLAAVYFLWGLTQFAMNAADAGGREEGKRKILYGIIGLVIMVSVYSILQILLRTFGIDIPDEIMR